MSANGKQWITGISITTALAAAFYSGILWQRVNDNSADIDKLVASVSALTGVVGDIRREQSRFEEIYRRLDRLEVNPRGNPR